MHHPFQPIEPLFVLRSFQGVKAQVLELTALVRCSPVQNWKDLCGLAKKWQLGPLLMLRSSFYTLWQCKSIFIEMLIFLTTTVKEPESTKVLVDVLSTYFTHNANLKNLNFHESFLLGSGYLCTWRGYYPEKASKNGNIFMLLLENWPHLKGHGESKWCKVMRIKCDDLAWKSALISRHELQKGY